MFSNNFEKKREEMVEKHLKKRGIENKAIISAFSEVPREEFVSRKYKKYAYADRPLPIAKNQTISQPYIVAEMLEAVKPTSDDILLEIGTGSGYAAAVASRVVNKVYGIERHKKLVEKSRKRFAELGYDNITIKTGDGSKGWTDKAPFNDIIVSAATEKVPENLLEQLAEKGRMVIPVGNKFMQYLNCYIKEKEKIKKKRIEAVRFVPLIRNNREEDK